MPAGWMTVALGLAMQVGQPAPSETPNYPAMRNANNHYGFEGQYEQRYPFDTQQNWVHGYFQEIPAYGGHAFYRPYNYKDVLAQSQTAAGWGASPHLPYSQQFWHRYHDQATNLKLSQHGGAPYPAAMSAGYAMPTQQFPGHAMPAPHMAPGSQPILPAGWGPAPQQAMMTPAPAYQTVQYAAPGQPYTAAPMAPQPGYAYGQPTPAGYQPSIAPAGYQPTMGAPAIQQPTYWAPTNGPTMNYGAAPTQYYPAPQQSMMAPAVEMPPQSYGPMLTPPR